MNSINHRVVDILADKGIDTLIYTKDDLGAEYVFNTESEVIDFFNQLDVKGTTIMFSPPNTRKHIQTLAHPVYEYSLDGVTVFITKFELS